MAKKYKYIDRATLQIVNRLSHDVFKYNRTLFPETVDALSETDLFPITFSMLHEHRAGEPCEAHVRCVIMTPKKSEEEARQTLILDMPMDIFDKLPEVEVPENNTETEPVEAT